MKLHMTIRLYLMSAAFICTLAACATQKGTPNLEVFPPPYIPIEQARVTIIPTSQFMKVAVLNFVDQTGYADGLVEGLADMLATEMHRTGRFEIYDRGHLRHYDFAQVLDTCDKTKGRCEEKDATAAGASVYHEHLAHARDAFDAIRADTDALLQCAITSLSDTSAKFDCRLVNSQSFTTMLASPYGVKYSRDDRTLNIERSGIARAADDIRSSLPKPDSGSVGKLLVQDGQVLTISMGRKDGIIPGMNVFVIGPGRVLSAGGGAPTTVDEVYLAQAYVVSVYDNTSQVVVFHGTDYRVGDAVRFK
jgi:hypothetical protein